MEILMKKHKALLAILAIALGAGLALSACDNGTAGTPRTIEGLFETVKSYEVGNLTAEEYGNQFPNGYRAIGNYCFQHKAWEPIVNGVSRHGESFRLADAQGISGWAFLKAADYTAASSSVAAAKNLIKALGSFYTDEYKLTRWYNVEGHPNGTPYIAWFSYWLTRDGSAACGYSAEPSVAPCRDYWYQF